MSDSKQYKNLFFNNREKCKELGLVLLPPAKEAEIQALTDTVGLELPNEIRDFYRFCNGFETDDFLFKILPINEILEYKHELETDSFYFAEYMIYSDTWIIQVKSTKKYCILNGDHGTDKPITLTNSIYAFLERYLIGDGLFGDSGMYKWRDSQKNNFS